MKYVIIKVMDMEVPIIFSDFIDHTNFVHMKPISAGKCKVDIDPDEGVFYMVYGNSVSLKLKSRPEDAELITNAFKFEE